MITYEEDLKRAVAYHGHLCSGQVLGVRMARLGLEIMGLSDRDPKKMRDLIVFVESDRCATDAAYVVTGATMGRRRMKYKDYGKMAMSFYYIPTKKAVRVYPVTDVFPPADVEDLVKFWDQYNDNDLFSWYNVEIDINENDLPGKPREHAVCSQCGERVLDGRHIIDNQGVIKCRACADGAYYKIIK